MRAAPSSGPFSLISQTLTKLLSLYSVQSAHRNRLSHTLPFVCAPGWKHYSIWLFYMTQIAPLHTSPSLALHPGCHTSRVLTVCG